MTEKLQLSGTATDEIDKTVSVLRLKNGVIACHENGMKSPSGIELMPFRTPIGHSNH